MSDLQELKTLVHELSHYYQHEHYKENDEVAYIIKSEIKKIKSA